MQQFKSKLPWSFDSTLSIYDKEIPVMIMCQWDFDDTEIDCDNEEYRKQFDNGNYANCYVVITIHGVNLTGSDRLFGIHCKSASLEQDLIQTIIEHSMLENAKENLKQRICSTLDLCKSYELV